MPLDKLPANLRRIVPESRMSRCMRWVFIFCLGFYMGEASHEVPEVAEAVQEVMK